MPGTIYFLEAKGLDLIKIGFTAGPPEVRIRRLRLVSPAALVVLGVIPGSIRREKKLHGIFRNLRSHGEWFRGEPRLRSYVARFVRPWEDRPAPPRPIVGRNHGKPVRASRITVQEWLETTTITSRGRTATAAKWAEKTGVSPVRMRHWLEQGVHPDNLFMIDLPDNPEKPYVVPLGLDRMIRV